MQERLEKIAPIEKYVAVFILAFQLFQIFRPISLLICFIFPLLHFTSFTLVKDFLEEKSKKVSFILLALSLSLMLFNVSALVFHKMAALVGEGPKALMFFFLVFNLLIIAGVLFGEKPRKVFADYYDRPVFAKSSGGIKKAPGNIKLCINADTGEDVIIPIKDRFLHMLILGPTGSGKTSQVIIPMLNQDIQNRDVGVTVIEPKGDLADKVMALGKHYGREVIYFNPIEPDCPSFNPLAGDETDVIENMATTFRMLNPDSSTYFQDLNNILIRNSLKVIKRLYGDMATMNHLSALLFNTMGQGKEMISELSRKTTKTTEEKKENDEVVSWFISDYFNTKNKTYDNSQGLRNQIAKINSNEYLRRVLNPKEGGSDINFDKVLEEGQLLSITTAQGTLGELGKYLGYFIILNFQSSVFRRPGNENTRRHHFLYIDEFQTYANNGFENMLTQGRSYRVASILATQNRTLIGAGAGRDSSNFIETVSTNARNVVVYPGASQKDADYYSKEFGEVEQVEIQKSISKPRFMWLGGRGLGNESFREATKVKPRFSPSDIIYRPFGEITYRIIINNSVTAPGVGKIEYIPMDLNNRLDEIIKEHLENQEKQRKLEEYEKALKIGPVLNNKPTDPFAAMIDDDDFGAGDGPTGVFDPHKEELMNERYESVERKDTEIAYERVEKDDFHYDPALENNDYNANGIDDNFESDDFL